MKSQFTLITKLTNTMECTSLTQRTYFMYHVKFRFEVHIKEAYFCTYGTKMNFDWQQIVTLYFTFYISRCKFNSPRPSVSMRASCEVVAFLSLLRILFSKDDAPASALPLWFSTTRIPAVPKSKHSVRDTQYRSIRNWAWNSNLTVG